MKQLEAIKNIIAGMLIENTGCSLLDSGDFYGRHWQKNRSKDFEHDEAVTVETRWLSEGDTISPQINLYHFLTANLTSDELTEEFNSAFGTMEDWDGAGYGLSRGASEWVKRTFHIDDDELGNEWVNTYNCVSLLSQDIQYRYIGRGYILLQVHGGCDARSGYTDAKLFKLVGDGLYHGVCGSVLTDDGTLYDVDTMSNGYCLTNEDGVEVGYQEGMIFYLDLVEY